MIIISPSPAADSRTCDYRNVSQQTLLDSSRQHIEDVQAGLAFFAVKIMEASRAHDRDKITDIEGFHRDFTHGFEEPLYTTWWTRHRALNRHHLTQQDGVPVDVNLIDVLDFITDCVMAGMARSGSVYPLALDPDVLRRAFENTVDLLKRNVLVSDAAEPVRSVKEIASLRTRACEVSPPEEP